MLKTPFLFSTQNSILFVWIPFAKKVVSFCYGFSFAFTDVYSKSAKKSTS